MSSGAARLSTVVSDVHVCLAFSCSLGNKVSPLASFGGSNLDAQGPGSTASRGLQRGELDVCGVRLVLSGGDEDVERKEEIQDKLRWLSQVRHFPCHYGK